MLDLLFKIMYEDDILKQIFILSLKSINIEEKNLKPPQDRHARYSHRVCMYITLVP